MGNNITEQILKDLEEEEQDFYEPSQQQNLVENDEITSKEAGFMVGYNQASNEEEEE